MCSRAAPPSLRMCAGAICLDEMKLLEPTPLPAEGAEDDEAVLS